MEKDKDNSKRYYCTFCKRDVLVSNKEKHFLCVTHIENKKKRIQAQSKKTKKKYANRTYYCEYCKLEMPYYNKYSHKITDYHTINERDNNINIKLNRPPMIPIKKRSKIYTY
jgi:hypothetical protein